MVSLCLYVLVDMSSLYAGGIFLNGVDISSARNQTLKNVNISISEDGTVFIEAPHYQVREDDIFTSLGKTSKGRFTGIARGEEKAVGSKGGTHPNSQVDPSTLPTYKEFQALSSKELKERNKAQEDEDSFDNDTVDKRRMKSSSRRARVADDQLQNEVPPISSEEVEASNTRVDKNVKTNKTTGKKSGNLLRRDEREELSR